MNTFIASLLMISHLNVQMAFQSVPLQFNFQEDYFQTEATGVMQADFELVGGLIFLNAKLERESQPFILDTGSPHLLLNSSWSRMKKNSEIGFKISGVKEMKMGKLYYKNKPFAYADLFFLQGEDEIRLDGLLGYPFLKEVLFSINFRKKHLCRWELKVKNDEPIQLAISKKKIKLTKAFYKGY